MVETSLYLNTYTSMLVALAVFSISSAIIRGYLNKKSKLIDVETYIELFKHETTLVLTENDFHLHGDRSFREDQSSISLFSFSGFADVSDKFRKARTVIFIASDGYMDYHKIDPDKKIIILKNR